MPANLNVLIFLLFAVFISFMWLLGQYKKNQRVYLHYFCAYAESRVEGSLAYPSYPGRAKVSYIPYKTWRTVYIKKETGVGSAGRVTRLAGSPFFDGRVILPAGPTSLHINTLARPAGPIPSGQDNQNMRERCGLGRRGKPFFSYFVVHSIMQVVQFNKVSKLFAIL